MSKAILKKYIQKQTGITPQEAGLVFDVVLNGITETLINDGKITLLNFGSFHIKTANGSQPKNWKIC